MKFTFPILTLCLGGAQRQLVELTNGLTARGHDVTILMPRTGKVEYEVFSTLKLTDPYYIRESDYPKSDVIVSNYYLTVPDAQVASEKGKGIHVRFSLCYEPAFLPGNHITFPSYQVTPHLLVVSSWQQQLIELNHGIRGHIVPIGVSRELVNLRMRPPHHPLQISTIVRSAEENWSWHRDQAYLIEQLERVRSHCPNVELNLICPPAELESSPQLQEWKRSGRFRFFLPSNDRELCYSYNFADIYVSSSVYDSGSLPGLEAMKCGAALVTTYAGGNMDYCRHEENCLVSYRHENRLAENVLRLLRDPELRLRLTEAGEREAGRWTWERSVAAFEAAVENIVKG
ncbi:glycosyltransferase family 4 protein [Paenibacillus sp. S-38]|uniref:glycosyltransferase family 4 protein n=1 Tax=Paenibacillus sp. S-38 TaxID=3416710 RepID=UPI003CE92280